MTTGSIADMNRKSNNRNHRFPSTPSTHAALLASFRQQMSDHARGERFKQLRCDRHLTQEQAGHEIGVSAKTIRTWEKGGRIEWDNAKAAGSFYDVDPEELVSREPGDLTESLSEGEREAPGLQRVEDQIAALREELLSELAEMRSERDDRRRQQKPSSKTPGRKRK